MSDFVQQQSVECRFDSSDSWVILSPIEQSIKSKIESIGTPLKDWDIQINYGIKTGFNDAFIINTEKRNEILDNCFFILKIKLLVMIWFAPHNCHRSIQLFYKYKSYHLMRESHF